MSEHANDSPLPRFAPEEAVAAHLTVTGMDCDRCATQVRQALLRLGGVVLARVSPDTGVAAVAYDPTRTFPAGLLAAVRWAARDGRHHFGAVVTRVGPAAELLCMLPKDKRRPRTTNPTTEPNL